MADSFISLQAIFDTERSLAVTASYQSVGSALTHNPVILIFDNQSTAAVQLSVDGTNTWKTFSAGEALVLDLRANKGNAPTFTIPIGTQFLAKGTAATGNFLISIIYAGN